MFNQYSIYFSLFIFLCLLSVIYLKISLKFNITDKPNIRTSHNTITPRGAGFIFPVSILIWAIIYQQYFYFIFGLVIISIISFIDDVFDLKQSARFIFQIISISCLFIQFDIISYSFILVAIIFILLLGWINAFNFMDGINGMSSSYSIVTISTLYYLNTCYNFINIDFLIFLLISVIIFSFFNFRNDAISFSGDVGSISLAYIFAFLFFKLILYSHDIELLILLSVYGVDSSLTIIERLINKENIFIAHKSHLYQLLSNEYKFSHLQVSFLYSIIQLIINLIMIVLIIPSTHSILFSILFLILIILFYIIVKRNIL